MLSVFDEGKTNYTAGNAEFAGTQNSQAESEKILHRILELNEGNLEIVGMPTILLAGDAMVAVLLKEKHKRAGHPELIRSEEHTSELQSLMRISYAVLCLKKKTKQYKHNNRKYTNRLETQRNTKPP